jgi:ATP-dependent DNA helicase MPH1
VGRTGRKRAGFVHVLLAEGREDLNFDKAKDTHKAVQKTILSGDQLELYADVERLLPEHIKPECLEKRMEIQEYIRDEDRRSRKEGNRSPTKTAKRKRNDDISRNIPTGASTGFVSVAELVVKAAKKRKKVSVSKDLDLAGQDDDTDLELESGLVMALPRRTKSDAVSKPPERRSRLRKTRTMDVSKKENKKKGESVDEPGSSQLSRRGTDDQDDLDIERGFEKPPAAHAEPEEPPGPENSNQSDTSSTGVIMHMSDPHVEGTSKSGIGISLGSCQF